MQGWCLSKLLLLQATNCVIEGVQYFVIMTLSFMGLVCVLKIFAKCVIIAMDVYVNEGIYSRSSWYLGYIWSFYHCTSLYLRYLYWFRCLLWVLELWFIEPMPKSWILSLSFMAIMDQLMKMHVILQICWYAKVVKLLTSSKYDYVGANMWLCGCLNTM